MGNIDKFGKPDNLKILQSFRFADLLYLVFISQKKFRVDEVAEDMGIIPDTLYRYCRGELKFPIDRLGDLMRATKWKGWLAYFLTGTEYEIKKKLDLNTQGVLAQLTEALNAVSRDGDTTGIEVI